MVPASTGDGTKARILLLDDDPSILETSRMMLDMLGYTVAAHNNGADALDALKADEFDLVFTDLDMPKMDGREFARAAREQGTTAKLVVVSGYYLDESDWEGEFDSVLMKPFRIQDLQAKIEELMAS